MFEGDRSIVHLSPSDFRITKVARVVGIPPADSGNYHQCEHQHEDVIRKEFHDYSFLYRTASSSLDSDFILLSFLDGLWMPIRSLSMAWFAAMAKNRSINIS